MAALGSGASGASVADLQRRLEALGFNPGPTDGVYGKQTMQAVHDYQASSGLAPSGTADLDTLNHLGSVIADGASAAPARGAAAGAINPEEDPAFLAFQRAQGYSEDQLRAQVAMARSRNDQNYANQLPVLAEQNRQANDDISNKYENMGDLGSGQRNLNLTRQATDYARQQGSAAQADDQANQDLEGGLAQQIAQNRINTAEQGLQTRDTLAQYNAGTLPAYSGAAYPAQAAALSPAKTAVSAAKPAAKNYNLIRGGLQ